MRVFLHCQDRWPPGLGLDGRIPPSLLGEEDSGYSSLQRISPDTFLSQTSLTHSHLSASWFLIICFGPLFAWFLGIQRLSPEHPQPQYGHGGGFVTVVSYSFDPMDCSPPGFSVCGIFSARIPEWVAISFSRGSSQPRDRTQVSCIAGRTPTLQVA